MVCVLVAELTFVLGVHFCRLHNQIWNYGLEGISGSNVPSIAPNTEQGQILHAIRVHLTILSHTRSHPPLGPLPL